VLKKGQSDWPLRKSSCWDSHWLKSNNAESIRTRDRPEKDSRDLSDSDSRDYALIVFRPRCIDAAAGVLSVDRETETLRISKYEWKMRFLLYFRSTYILHFITPNKCKLCARGVWGYWPPFIWKRCNNIYNHFHSLITNTDLDALFPAW
jgi:hypothetical protein